MAQLKENELLKNKEFSLLIKDGEQYRPITLKEFKNYSLQHPELFKYFFNEQDIQSLEIPNMDEPFTNIYYHWEKAALRMI